jgi:hypothetical protein
VVPISLGDSYATLAELRGRVGITDAAFTTEDTRLTAALATASRGIENLCNRQFNVAGSATARVFEPWSDRLVKVDDISTTSGLVIKTDTGGDGTYSTTLTSSQYQLRPLNGVVDGESGWPYYEIEAIDHCWPTRWDIAPVQVTANWGWSAVPTPVKEGALILAEEIYRLKEMPFGVGGYGQFGIIRARANPMVLARIGPYIRDPIMVG